MTNETLLHIFLIVATYALIYTIWRVFNVFFQEFMDYVTDDERHNTKQQPKRGEE